MANSKGERKRLSDLLVEIGIVDRAQVQRALQVQRQSGGRLLRALVDGGAVDEDRLTRALSSTLGVETVTPGTMRIHERVLSMVPARLAQRYGALPIAIKRANQADYLYVAMADPLDTDATADIERSTGCRLSVLIAPPTQLDTALEHYYGPAPAGGAAVDGPPPIPNPGGEIRVVAGMPVSSSSHERLAPPERPLSGPPPSSPLIPAAKRSAAPPGSVLPSPSSPPPFTGPTLRTPSQGLPAINRSGASRPAGARPAAVAQSNPGIPVARDSRKKNVSGATPAPPIRRSEPTGPILSESVPGMKPSEASQEALEVVRRAAAGFAAPAERTVSDVDGLAGLRPPPIPPRQGTLPQVSRSGPGSDPDINPDEHDGLTQVDARLPEVIAPMPAINYDAPSADATASQPDWRNALKPVGRGASGIRIDEPESADISSMMVPLGADLPSSSGGMSGMNGIELPDEAPMQLDADSIEPLLSEPPPPLDGAPDEPLELAFSPRPRAKASQPVPGAAIELELNTEVRDGPSPQLHMPNADDLSRASYNMTFELPIEVQQAPSPFDSLKDLNMRAGLERTGIIPLVDLERDEFVPPPFAAARVDHTDRYLVGSGDIPISAQAVKARSERATDVAIATPQQAPRARGSIPPQKRNDPDPPTTRLGTRPSGAPPGSHAAFAEAGLEALEALNERRSAPPEPAEGWPQKRASNPPPVKQPSVPPNRRLDDEPTFDRMPPLESGDLEATPAPGTDGLDQPRVMSELNNAPTVRPTGSAPDKESAAIRAALEAPSEPPTASRGEKRAAEADTPQTPHELKARRRGKEETDLIDTADGLGALLQAAGPDRSDRGRAIPSEDQRALVGALVAGRSLNSAERAQLVLGLGRLLLKKGLITAEELAETLRE